MRVDIGGLRLFFDVEGAGLAADGPITRAKPALLLLHGGPGVADHTSFKPWFGRFADTHQVIYLDHRGQGRSDQRDDPAHWDIDTWAEDVVRFCAALEIEHPVLLGNSFGGMVAMAAAGRHPDLASKVILSSTFARVDVNAIAEAMERLGGRTARETAIRFWSGDLTPDVGAAYLQTCNPLLLRHPREAPGGLDTTTWNLDLLAHFVSGEWRTMDLRADLSKIECPVLVLAGEDDPACTPSAHDEIVAALPPGRTQYHLLPDCGHGTFRDQPERTETLLREFLSGS
jgi:proline iminopeptidase